MPRRRLRAGNPAPLFFFAALCGVPALFWNGPVRTARTQAAAIREWADSDAVASLSRTASHTSPKGRKAVLQAQRSALTVAYTNGLDHVPDGGKYAGAIPNSALDVLSNAIVKRPSAIVPILQNEAARLEISVFPMPDKVGPTLVPILRDQSLFNNISLGLLGGTCLLGGLGVLFIGVNVFGSISDRVAVRPAPVAAPVHVPVPQSAPVPAPRIPVATPFPPPPDSGTPTINAPRVGGMADGVAKLGSSSAEVLRLIKRLEELENLSEQMKDERDETRKELTWTQSALDDFRRRVSDASTMAAASAAQSAGASEQRAAQAEQRVTEAVEQINEALMRAVEAEQSVSQVKEKAQTAEERAAHAEVRSQEMQFQLARAMERLADLERLAATTRLGGLPSSPIALNAPLTPPALPAPDAKGTTPTLAETNSPSGVEAMLLTAAAPNPRANGVYPPANGTYAYSNDSSSSMADDAAYPAPMMADEESPLRGGPPSIPVPGNRGIPRTPPQRLTNSKMSEIEAGLKLARSIRTRTQKPGSDTSDSE